MISRRAGVLVALGLVLAMAMGCTGAQPSGGGAKGDGASEEDDTWTLTPEEMEAEYWEATETLTLPEDAEWPGVFHLSPAPDHQGVVRGHVYEPGYGVADAYHQWFCAWQREWLAQRGEDPEREAEALEMLLSYPDLERYDEFNDPASTQINDEEILNQARLGDPSGISRNVELGCREPG